jgi:hypothetical protein
MSKFMAIVGILAAAIGVALGLMGYLTPSEMQVRGITQEVAAIFLIGGLGLIGIGGIIGAIEHSASATRELRQWLAGHDGGTHAEFIPAAAAGAVAARGEAPEVFSERAKDVVDTVKTSTADTIAALDKAKEDISKALGVTAEPPAAAPSPPPVPPSVAVPETPAPAAAEPAVVEVETAVDEEQLFVVDEKVIRGRPARVLSDGTVEAETDEGWMRFENLEHLEEYLDAVTPPAKA